MSLGSLIQGFQSGYRFVDDIDRQNREDQYKEEVRGRQRKEWANDDEYQNERKASYQRHYGQQPEAPAEVPADVNPARVAAMEQGAGVRLAPVPAPQVQAQPMPPAPVANTGAAVDMTTAGQGRGFVNPPTITAADRSVAPGKVDLNRMNPAQKQNLLALAEKQFGMRHGPGDGGQFINASMPQPAAQVAAQQGAAQVQTKINRPDSSTDMNKAWAFAIEQAKIDAKYGKKGGEGMVALAKAAEAWKREGMDRATTLMHQGRWQEAADIMNGQGDHVGIQIVSATPSTYKVGKDELPTYVVTMRKEDGTVRTINTAQNLAAMMEVKDQLKNAQEGRKIDVDAERNGILKAHYEAAAKNDSAARAIQERQVKLAETREQNDTIEGKMAQITKALGPLTPEEDKAYRKSLLGIKGKDAESRIPFYQKVVEKAVEAGTVKPQDAGKELSRLLKGDQVADDEAIVSKELIDSRDKPEVYATKYEQATKIMPPARLKELGFAPPAPKKNGSKTPADAAVTNGTGTGPKQSWKDTVASKEAQYQNAGARQAQIDADPELQALQKKKQAAAAKGDLPAARQFLREYEAVKAQRYAQ